MSYTYQFARRYTDDALARALNEGEPGFSVWSKMLYVGDGTTNQRFAPDRCYDARAYGAVGTPTDDSVAIQAAINAAGAAGGGAVAIPSGIYLASGLLLKNNVAIVGMGRGTTTLRLPAGVAAWTRLFTNDDTTVGNSHVAIAHLTLDGNRAANAATAGLSGIILEGASTKCHIYDCYITGFTHSGIQVEPNSTDGATENTIEGNIIDDYGTGGVGFGIILIRGASRNIVCNNYITSTLSNVGVAVDDYSSAGNSYDSRYNSLIGNHITGAGIGIVLQGCTRNLVANNIVSTPTSRGIQISQGDTGDNARTPVLPDYNLIIGNVITLTGSTTGIYYADGLQCSLNNNHIDGGQYSIYLYSVPMGFEIVGNTLTGMTDNAIYWADGGQRFLIASNNIDGAISGGYCKEAVYLSSGAIVALKSGQVLGNSFNYIGREAVKVVKDTAICQDIDIRGNRLFYTAQEAADTYYGIRVQGACERVFVEGNRATPTGYIALVCIDNDASDCFQSGNGDSPQWDFSAFTYKHVSATSGSLTGATDKIETNIPAGALIVGVSMNVEEAVTDSGGNDTWSAAFSGGNTTPIVTGASAAANTKVKLLLNTNASSALCSSEADITLTPNGGNFTAGEIRAVVWYATAESLPDA